MNRPRNGFAIFVVLLTVFSVSNARAGFMDGVKKIYVVDFTGDISKKWGQTLASACSTRLLTALKDSHVEVFTWLNLKQQLKVEQKKEILQCSEDQGCIEEVISGFGIAVKLFGHITRLSKDKFSVALSLMRRGKPMNKVFQVVNTGQDGLLSVVPGLALRVVGAAPARPRATGPEIHFSTLPPVPQVQEVEKLNNTQAQQGMDLGTVNVDALEAYDRALRLDKSNADPTKKAQAWRTLGQRYPIYANLASQRAVRW